MMELKVSKPLIELLNVSTGYESTNVLENVNLKIFPNDFIGVIGPNGGGKTTLVKVILGSLKPRGGKISFYDRKIKIGYLPQYHNFDSSFPISVEETILMGLMNQWTPFFQRKNIIQQKLLQTLERLNISHLRNKYIGELSGGEMQKVFLARAVISEPELLLLDEPDTYIDNRFENELYEILKEINKTTAIVLVSHDAGIISSYVKSIACVNKQVHYHPSNEITEKMLKVYNCPIDLITHGNVPHRVLKLH